MSMDEWKLFFDGGEGAELESADKLNIEKIIR